MLKLRECRWGDPADGLEGWHGENGMRLSRKGCRLVLRALAALALTVSPLHLSIDGSVVVAKAYAAKGGNGNGNGGNGRGNGGSNGGSGNSGNGNSGNGNGGGNGGNGNGNGGSSGDGGGNNGNGGSNGNGAGASGNGNSGNGNSGNGNSGNGNSGNGDSGNGSSGNGSSSGGDSGGDTSSGTTSNTASGSLSGVADHVNNVTGDKVRVRGSSIEVTHRNGMKEKIANGRFRMEDKFGRTIVDRKATGADLNRLKSL